MQNPFPEDSHSLLIKLPSAVFGQGRGQYWHYLQLVNTLKRAVADQTCAGEQEDVDNEVAWALIADNLSADLRKYALDYPQTDRAEHIRQGGYIGALYVKCSKPPHQLEHSESPHHSAAPSIQPLAAMEWDAVILKEAIYVLVESAKTLGSTHRYSLTVTLIIFLLMCRRAGLTFLDPQANNISAVYFELLTTQRLIERPSWMQGEDIEWRRLYKTWQDIYKAHGGRIMRAKYQGSGQLRIHSVFGLTETGEAYFMQHLLNSGIEHTILEKSLERIKHQTISLDNYAASLRQSADGIDEDKLLSM